MERCLSGLKGHPAKVLDLNGSRGFKSLPLRHFSKFGFWAISASPRQRRGSASTKILKGFLKSKNSFCPLKRKFEPIFFRKSRPCSGFSCKAVISACFTVFMNLAASSNRLLLLRNAPPRSVALVPPAHTRATTRNSLKFVCLFLLNLVSYNCIEL